MKASIFKLTQKFIQDHLVKTRGLSPHTVSSYKATLKMFFKYIATIKKKKIIKLSLADFTSKSVLGFLNYIEKEKNNSIRTRNQRLAVIKSFCSFLLYEELSISDELQKIRMIKMKKEPHKPPEYLTEQEVKSILDIFDVETIQGLRDRAIFVLMYNTGMRASELCGLTLNDIDFEKPYKVKIHGKGQKIRFVPLWEETINILNSYLAIQTKVNDKDYIFKGKQGAVLSRHGLLYLIKVWSKKAELNGCKTLKKKKVTPHTMRHTTAMHLLQSGVDIAVIKSWLGHVDLNTTHGYVEINLKMKKTALDKLSFAQHTKTIDQVLKENDDVLRWIDEL